MKSIKETQIASWSHVLPTKTKIVKYHSDIFNDLQKPFIPRGSGRSFGDQAYITNNITLTSEKLNQITEFDTNNGTLVCDSGVQIGDLFDYLEQSEWTFAVGGGTQWVTIGGAVASDIHGKNDQIYGSFGNQVKSLQMIIASGQQLECSKEIHPDLFKATIGGMGLTGFIKKVKLKLQKSSSRVVHMQTKNFHDISEMIEFFNHTQCDLQSAWIDLTIPQPRGVYHYASYREGNAKGNRKPIELMFPRIKLLNQTSVKYINALKFSTSKNSSKVTNFRNFHFAVDTFKYWNRLYGPKGFQEYQFLVPAHHIETAYNAFIKESRKFSLTPLFTVVKKLGPMPRMGLLSFPKSGFTLLADFETKPENQKFFTYFTDLILELEGKIYLAKDSYLTKQQFEKMENNVLSWRNITKQYDPQNFIQSDLSIRLNMKPW